MINCYCCGHNFRLTEAFYYLRKGEDIEITCSENCRVFVSSQERLGIWLGSSLYWADRILGPYMESLEAAPADLLGHVSHQIKQKLYKDYGESVDINIDKSSEDVVRISVPEQSDLLN